MTGKNILDEHKVINISEEYRQMMFDSTKREYIRDDGAAKGPTKRTEIYTAYQKSEKLENRLKGSWTIQQYENLYRREFYNAVKRANPNWKIGDVRAGLNGPFWAGLKGPKISRIKKANAPKSF